MRTGEEEDVVEMEEDRENEREFVEVGDFKRRID